ncbi:hypothetical protein JCM19046_4521 [Bacillus sp. JCM 19046]|nr:hypothetical protein JCM19045_4694 [Bacillus sp. JCM 19045]GAF19839.1 hypothetical protein JCM19046_4521 [Bacillus sp. JCM 19046]
MLGFKKKGLQWKEENERLYGHLDLVRERLEYKKKLLNHSIDVSDEVLIEVKRSEMIYSLLLREARIRHNRKR